MILENKTNKDTAKIDGDKHFNVLPFFREEKAQKITGITLTLLALSFFGFFAMNPTFSTVAKLQKEIKDNEFVNSQLEQKIVNINKLKLQFATLQNDLPLVLDSMPKKADVPLLVAQIQSLAAQYNINLRKIQNFEVELFKNKKTDKKYYSYNFSIAGSGTYEDISQFISNITSMQRIVDVDTLSLERSGTQDSSSVEFSINAVSFFKE